MSRTYSPGEMATPRDPSREPRENERGHDRGQEGQDQGRSGGRENQPRPNEAQEVRSTEARALEPRKPYEHRKRTYTLRSSEISTMIDIGKFRAVAAKDLEEFAYGGDRRHLDLDLTTLRRQGLIVERDIPHHESSSRRLLALTKEGHRLLVATQNAPNGQALYHGFIKPREAHHDADLYRLYQRGLERIAHEGGKNIRVILDSELKKHLYRDLTGHPESIKRFGKWKASAKSRRKRFRRRWRGSSAVTRQQPTARGFSGCRGLRTRSMTRTITCRFMPKRTGPTSSAIS